MQYAQHPVTISSGQTVSAVCATGNETIVGMWFPASFEGATITLSAALSSGGTYNSVTDPTTGSAVSIYAGAAKFVNLLKFDLSALQYFKITSASSVAADRTIYVITRKMA